MNKTFSLRKDLITFLKPEITSGNHNSPTEYYAYSFYLYEAERQNVVLCLQSAWRHIHNVYLMLYLTRTLPVWSDLNVPHTLVTLVSLSLSLESDDAFERSDSWYWTTFQYMGKCAKKSETPPSL